MTIRLTGALIKKHPRILSRVYRAGSREGNATQRLPEIYRQDAMDIYRCIIANRGVAENR